MKLFLLVFILFFSTSAVSTPSKQSDFYSFDLQNVLLNQLVSLYFKEVFHKPYVLCDELLKDQRYVSFRASGPVLEPVMIHAVLSTYGYEVRELSGILTVCAKASGSSQKLELTKGKPFFYRPKYHDVGYLVELLTPLVEGAFSNYSQIDAKSGSGRKEEEFLVFSGNTAAVKRLRELLIQVDVPSPSVVVRAVLYEVSKGKRDASALKLIAELLREKVQISFGISDLANSLSIKKGGLELVASLISEDSRFKVVTSPFARVRNNQTVRLQVGADVPVAGQILFNPNGQATRSSNYHSSGVILEVTARIRGCMTDLDLAQVVSNFVKTTAGSSDNPTLNKREIRTSLSVANGELVVLGGLVNNKAESVKSGVFGWNFSTSRADTDSELILLLQVERI